MIDQDTKVDFVRQILDLDLQDAPDYLDFDFGI